MKLHGSTLLVILSDIFGFVICTEPLLRDGSLCNNLPSGLEKQPERVIVKRGEPLLLNCILNRFFALDSRELPQKNITWIKNGLPIESKSILGHTISYSNGSLFVPHTISLASSDDGADDGFYFCIVNYLSETFISSGTHVTVAALGKFSYQPETTSIADGFYHRLNCSIEKASPKPTITWFKNDAPVLNTSAYHYLTITNNGGSEMHPLSVTHSNLSVVVLPSGVLELGPVSAIDAGDYYCSASNGIKTRRSSLATLTILPKTDEDPHPTSIEGTPKNLSVVLGSTAYLDCFATGFPRPVISWEKNGVGLDLRSDPRLSIVGRGTLVIAQTKPGDAGQYRCKADNDVGRPQTASATITVLAPPVFQHQPNCENFMIPGQSVRLQCTVSGNPKPSITWYKDGRQLRTSRRLLIHEQEIRIQSASAKDVGAYHCIATNLAGSIYAAMKVVLSNGRDGEPVFVSSIFDDYKSASSRSNVEFVLKLKHLTSNSALVGWRPAADIFYRRATYKIIVTDADTHVTRILQSSTRERTIPNLQPGHQIKVALLNQRDKSKELCFVVPSSSNNIADAVRNFAVTALSSTTVSASWDTPLSNTSRPTRYKLTVEETSSDVLNRKEMEVAETNAKAVRLKKYTRYTFRVAAVHANGETGPYTPAVVVRTEGGPPDQAPSNITVTMESGDRFGVEWAAPSTRSVNGELTGFRIKYKERHDKGSITRAVPPDSNHFLLEDLKRNTEYVLRMQTLNNFGDSPLSRKVTFRTPRRVKLVAENRPPGKPRRISTEASPTSITVSWEPPEGNVYVQDYIIGWGANSPQKETRVDGKRRAYDIMGLEPSTLYFLSVGAGNHIGVGERFLKKVRTTATEDDPKELYPPLGVHVDVLTPTTLNVSWHDSNRKRDSQYYAVRYKTNLPGKPRARFVNSTDLNCLIHGLRPHTYYEIAVRVVQEKRRSEWSMTETATTKESKPGTPPTDLNVVPFEDSPTAVQLNWQPPSEPNGVLDGYLIFYTTDPQHSISDWVIEPAKGEKMSKVINNLTPETQYYFKVLGSNAAGNSPYSEVVGYRTKKADEVPEPWSMPTWIWYMIIGGVTILVVCIVIVATLVICRNRSSPKRRSKSNASMTSTRKYPDRSLSRESWSTRSRFDPYGDGQGLDPRGAKALYPFQDYTYGTSSADLMPVNSQMLPRQDVGYVRGYPYATYHPSVTSNGPRSVGNYSLTTPAHYSDMELSIPEDHLSPCAPFLPSVYSGDCRYSPVTSGGSHPVSEGNGDSAYGSDYPPIYPTDESPHATVQHRKKYGSLEKKLYAEDKESSSVGSSRSSSNGGHPDSIRDSRSESLLTDMNEDLANVVKFVRDMKASTEDTDGFLK